MSGLPSSLRASLRAGCEQRCPGCSHRLFSQAESEEQKSDWLQRKLLEVSTEFGKRIEPLRSVPGEARFGYREKTTLHASWNGEVWSLGLQVPKGDYRRGKREYEVVSIPHCPVHSEKIRRVVSFLVEKLPRPSEEAGPLPLVFVAMTGSLLTLVLKEKPPIEVVTALERRLKNLLTPLLSDGTLDGVFLNYNPAAGGRVFSSRGWKLILGSATSNNRGVEHGPQSFQQLIPGLYEGALKEASSFFELARGDLVLDLYCGLGISLQKWQSQDATSVGVEMLGEAVALARERLNTRGALTFFQGRVSERLPQLDEIIADWKKRTSHGRMFIFSNPPRTGMEPEVLDWISTTAKPSKIAYLSCSAGTLGRDLSQLSAYGLKRIIPYDFFPNTHHLEALACLDLDSSVGDRASASLKRVRRTDG